MNLVTHQGEVVFFILLNDQWRESNNYFYAAALTWDNKFLFLQYGNQNMCLVDQLWITKVNWMLMKKFT